MEKYVKKIKETICFIRTIDEFDKLLRIFHKVKQGK